MKKVCVILSLIFISTAILISCAEKESALILASPAFTSDETMPVKFTCDGDDISPALSWSYPPDGTKSFALICDDPDAPGGTFVHWIIFNIPGSSTVLNENISHQKQLVGGILQGMNDFREIGYRGPCPPSGKPHHYRFKLYALDSMLEAPPGATEYQFENALKGHVLDLAELSVFYGR